MQHILQSLERIAEGHVLSVTTDGPYVYVDSDSYTVMYDLERLETIGLSFHGMLGDTYILRRIDVEPVVLRVG
jgi:hypothetical protein